jgi:hypothetical protein
LIVTVGAGLAMIALPLGWVQGQVRQSKDVTVGDTKGRIEAPDVMASVIYGAVAAPLA